MPFMTILDAGGPRLVDVQETKTGAHGLTFRLSITVGKKDFSSGCGRIRCINCGGNENSATISYNI